MRGDRKGNLGSVASLPRHEQAGSATPSEGARALSLIRQVVRAIRNDSDLCGELFRSMAFDGPEGCYYTFDLIDTFEPVLSNRLIFEALWGRKARPDDAEEIGCIEAHWSRTLGLFVAWHWDGDGQLYFSAPDFKVAVTNTDCKCHYDWHWASVYVPEDGSQAPPLAKGDG